MTSDNGSADRKQAAMLSIRSLSFLAMAVAAALVVSLAAPRGAEANPRYAGLVIDAVSGEVFYEENADAARYPASLTKMMTLYMIFRELDRGTLTLGGRIRISRHAAAQPPSRLGLPPGSSLTVEQAIYALVTKSANDVAAAVAEAIGGTESGFAEMMTAEARRLGMTATTFRNASGLPDSRQRTTARDMARLSQALLYRFPHYYHYFNTRTWSFNGHTYRNHNRLLGQYAGLDGLKTGYIRASGFNLAASAVRGELRVIAIVFGGRTAQSRNNHMVDLLDRAFDSRRGQYLIAHGSVPFTPPVPGRPPRFSGEPAVAAVRTEEGSLAELSPFDPPVPLRRPGAVGAVTVAASTPVTLLPPPSQRDAVSAPVLTLAPPTSVGGDRAPDFVLVSNAEPAAAGRSVAVSGAAEIGGDLFLSGSWGIQIGAFAEEEIGRQRIDAVMTEMPQLLGAAVPEIVRVDAATGTLYRTRLHGIPYESATAACAQLIHDGAACLTLAPQ